MDGSAPEAQTDRPPGATASDLSRLASSDLSRLWRSDRRRVCLSRLVRPQTDRQPTGPGRRPRASLVQGVTCQGLAPTSREGRLVLHHPGCRQGWAQAREGPGTPPRVSLPSRLTHPRVSPPSRLTPLASHPPSRFGLAACALACQAREGPGTGGASRGSAHPLVGPSR